MQQTLVTTAKQGLQTLPVMETFYSVQGEGYHTGKPAFFIRLAGCDVGCTWCDVKESWNASDHPVLKIKDLAKQAALSGAEIVVVTGGEPTLYDLKPLTDALLSHGLKAHIETSGTNPLTGDWHWICFSPKKFKKPVPQIYQQAHELKVVVFNKHDLQWALDHAAQINESCKLFVQPEWSKKEIITPLIVEFVQQNTHWSLSLQTHKYLNLP